MRLEGAIGRPRSLAALEDAVDWFLIVATQRDAATENPSLEELHPVGCIVRVVRVIDAKREGKQAIVVGVARTRIVAPPPGDTSNRLPIDPLDEREPETPERDAAWQRVVALAHRVIDLHDDYPDEWKTFVQSIPTPGLLADCDGFRIDTLKQRLDFLGGDPWRKMFKVKQRLPSSSRRR